MYCRVQGQLGLWCELLSNQGYTMRTIRKREGEEREELGARQKGREGNVRGEVEKEERERESWCTEGVMSDMWKQSPEQPGQLWLEQTW